MPYNTAARTAGIDRNEEITSLSPYVYNTGTLISSFYCSETDNYSWQLLIH